jgi:hypothetical protein
MRPAGRHLGAGQLTVLEAVILGQHELKEVTGLSPEKGEATGGGLGKAAKYW